MGSASDRPWPRWALVIAMIGSAAVAPEPADAQDPDALQREGESLFKEGRIEEACARLSEAIRLRPKLMLQRELASCHLRLGLVETAHRELVDVVKHAEEVSDVETLAQARKNLKISEEEGPYLHVEVLGAPEAVRDVTVSVDKTPIDLSRDWARAHLIDAGAHEVRFHTTYLDYPQPITVGRKDGTVSAALRVGLARIGLAPGTRREALTVKLDGVSVDTSLLDKPTALTVGQHRVEVGVEARRPYERSFTVVESGPAAQVLLAEPEGKAPGAVCVINEQCASLSCAGNACCAHACTEKGATCATDGVCRKPDDPTAPGQAVAIVGGFALVAGVISSFVLIGSSVARATSDDCKTNPSCSAQRVQVQSMWSTIISGSTGAVLLGTGLLMARHPAREPRLVPVACPGGGALVLTGAF